MKGRKSIQASIFAVSLVGILCTAIFFFSAVALIRDPNMDRSAAAVYNYLTGFSGVPSFLFGFWWIVVWLRQRGRPADPVAKLRTDVIHDLHTRMERLRIGQEDVVLKYVDHGSSVALEVATAPRDFQSQIVLVGRPGAGKTYSAIQFANLVLRVNENVIPIVIQLSRWDGSTLWQPWLVEQVSHDFNLSPQTVRDLLINGRLLPVIDAIDEAELHTGSEDFVTLVKQILSARVLEQPMPLLMTCRSATWSRIRADVSAGRALRVYFVRDVSRDEARDYVRRSLRLDDIGPVDEFLDGLLTAGGQLAIKSPWRLSVASSVAASSGLEEAIASVARGRLLERFVQLTVDRAAKGRFARLNAALNIRWLSAYAKYLTGNRSGVYIAGRLLETRDLQLHRLWPSAGRVAPRIVDLAMCVVLSLPGLVWGFTYLWERGNVARFGISAAGVLWVALLVRTSLKPWVPASTQDFSRLRQPRFVARQTLLSALLGAASWLTFGPLVAAVAFVTAWVAIGLTVGFGQSLTTDGEVRVVGPEGVLARERRISRSAAWSLAPLLSLAFAQTWGLLWGPSFALLYCAVVGETVGCALWRRYLAMAITSGTRLSPTPRATLRQMHDYGFVRVAGLSYQFRHDELLEYFNSRTNESLPTLVRRSMAGDRERL